MRLVASHDACRIIRRPIEQLRAQDRRSVLLAEEFEAVRERIEPWARPGPQLLEMERAETEVVGDRVRNQARIASIEQTIDETRLVIDALANVRLAEVVAELREVEMRLSD